VRRSTSEEQASAPRATASATPGNPPHGGGGPPFTCQPEKPESERCDGGSHPTAALGAGLCPARTIRRSRAPHDCAGAAIQLRAGAGLQLGTVYFERAGSLPLFDHADDYHRTVYEERSVLDWFRGILQTDGGLNTSKMSVQWCRNVLRMVTPHMWICRALLEQVDRAALEAVAQVTETNDAFRIALREGQGLDDLELALLPVLPVESVRVHQS